MRIMKTKLILCLSILLFLLSGCTQEISDYESYFPDNEIIFDNEEIVLDDEQIVLDDEQIHLSSDNYFSDDAVSAASYNTTEQNDVLTVDTNNPSETVWIPKSGKKYHNKPNCSNMKSAKEVTIDEAIESGYEACKRCYK